MFRSMRRIRALADSASVEALEPRLLFDAALTGSAGDGDLPAVLLNDGGDRPDRLTAISMLFGPDAPAQAAEVALRLYAVRGLGTNADPLLERFAVSAARFSYDADSGCARWDLDGLDLEPGLYRAVLTTAGVSPGGEPLSAAAHMQTLHLLVAAPGDANRDGRVDLLDLAVLDEGLGLTGDAATWGVGDFDGDGVVSVSDRDVVEAHLGLDVLPSSLRAAADLGQLDPWVSAGAPADEATAGSAADFRARVRADLTAGDMDSVRADIDALLRAVHAGRTDAAYDLDADGQLTRADADTLITSVIGTEYGDFTLDGKIDTADLTVLAANWQSLQSCCWSSGDATGDGNVDAADLSLMAVRWGFGESDGNPAPPAGHEVVPETNAERVRAGEFHVWNWINAPGAPSDLSAAGVHSIVKVTWRDIYLPEQYDNWEELPPDADAIAQFAETIPDGAFVVTDVEGWALDGGNATVAAERWVLLNDLLREATAGRDVAIGQFNAIRSPRWSIMSSKVQEFWLEYNRQHRGAVLDSLDADCSDLYARGPVYEAADPVAAWTATAENLKALHDELAPDQPFIPFLSPRWWAKGESNYGEYVPADLWQAMLDWCSENTDGVVVYHGYADSPSWETFSQTEHWAALNELAGGEMLAAGEAPAPLAGGVVTRDDPDATPETPSEPTDAPLADAATPDVTTSESDPAAGPAADPYRDAAEEDPLDESLERLARLGLVPLETL